MTQVILIRHGQASFGSQNYDQLSSLGLQQSKWLGTHLSQRGKLPSRVISGTLERHKQTALGILSEVKSGVPLTQDESWNEFDFKKIVYAYLHQHPE